VALARALVRRPAIWMLDEATGALDAVTEQAVQQELAKLSCTRIVIAHRLRTAHDGAYARLIAAQVEPKS